MCSICLEPTDCDYTTTCGHKFHRLCVEEWAKIEHTCPNCRKWVLDQDFPQKHSKFPKDIQFPRDIQGVGVRRIRGERS